MMNLRKHGFTLIELLIVVAIIAILAAIAVPNFLEAQTRSKISRCMADMRSAGVAMTAYFTDYQKYPLGKPQDMASGMYIGYMMIAGGTDYYAGRRLTTPVAFLTSFPLDSFNTAMALRGDWKVGKACSWVASILNPGKDGAFEGWFVEMKSIWGLFPRKLNWCFESCGPDLVWWSGVTASGQNLGRQPNRFIYDPTNGTTSQGQLVYADVGWISPAKK